MRILIIKPSSLGDVILTLPALAVLREAFPDGEIGWLVSPENRGILPGKPWLDRTFDFPRRSKSPRVWLGLIGDLRRFRPDLVLDFQGLLRSGLLSFAAGKKERIGFAQAREGSRYFYTKRIDSSIERHALERNLDLARSVGASSQEILYPLFQGDPAEHEKLVRLLPRGDFIALCPAARWSSKRWPVHRWASLCRRLRQAELHTVLIGGPGDATLCNEIVQEAGTIEGCVSLAGKTSLRDAAFLMARATGVVTVDTGLMHLGAALGTPLVALFGPTSEKRTGPFSDKVSVQRVESACGPCFRKHCDDPKCMIDLDENVVFLALEKLLGSLCVE